MIKLRLYKLLEYIDAHILHCKIEPFCYWLLYSEYWLDTRLTIDGIDIDYKLTHSLFGLEIEND